MPNLLNLESDFNLIRTITRKVLNQPPRHNFLRKELFPNTLKHETKKVVWDNRKVKNDILPFVHPQHDAVVVGKDPFTTKEISPAYFKPFDTITPAELFDRIFDEDPSKPLSLMDKLEIIVTEIVLKHQNSLALSEEYMCSQALFAGKLDVYGYGYDDAVDYGYTDDNFIILGGTSKWSDYENSNPLKDINNALGKALENGKNFHTVIMGSQAADYYQNHPKVENRLNIINIHNGIIKPTQRGNGISKIGEHNLANGHVEILTYNMFVTKPGSSVKIPMVPPNSVMLYGDMNNNEFHYGAIQNMNGLNLGNGLDAGKKLHAGKEFLSIWTENNGTAKIVMTESAPMPCIKDTDSVMIMEVC